MTPSPMASPRDTTTSENSLPCISLVVPIYNERDYIRTLVESIAGQTYPQDKLELILVDGMSDDGTREIVLELRQELSAKLDDSVSIARDQSGHLRLIDNPERIAPCAMNAGIRAARFDVVLRMDGHAKISSDYVEKIVRAYVQLDAGSVGGIVISKGRGLIGRAIAHVMGSRLGVGNSTFRTSSGVQKPRSVDTVPFGVFNKSLLRQTGLFDERFVRHQDYELNYRIRTAGYPIYLIPDVEIEYYVRNSVRALVSQYFQYGYWKGRFLRMYPQALKIRHLIPPLFVAGGLLALILAPLWYFARQLALLQALDTPDFFWSQPEFSLANTA